MQSHWRKFWRTALSITLGGGLLLYAAILLVDPFDALSFSLPVERAPVVTNQRYSFPALARKDRFDSAVIGTSTTRLLRPANLDRSLGGSFVNLSMNSGTAWEQAQILDLFRRHHPSPRTVIIGMDIVWCRVEAEYEKLTFRPFPPWLYDDNPWNDLLHHFDLKTIEQAALQLAYITGLQPARRGLDGYTNFLPPRSEYDLARARGHIYGQPEPKPFEPVVPPVDIDPATRNSWVYASHALLAEMLAELPDETTKILLLVPYHRYNQPRPGSEAAAQLEECKRRLTEMAATRPNGHVVDFMIDSEITRRDENYWDVLHYGVDVAARLADLIAEAAAGRADRDDLYRYLTPSRFGE